MSGHYIPVAPALIAVLFGLACVIEPLGRRERDQLLLTLIGVGLICGAVFGVSLPVWMGRLA